MTFLFGSIHSRELLRSKRFGLPRSAERTKHSTKDSIGVPSLVKVYSLSKFFYSINLSTN
jgi:hypothetical protein